MSVRLDPRGTAIRVGSVTLRTPGLAGEARARGRTAPGMRSTEHVSNELERALANEGLETRETIELERTVAHGAAAPQIVVEAPDPGPSYGQVILHANEEGVWRWALPVAADSSEQTMRRGTRTFVLPGDVVPPAPDDAPRMRGLSGLVAKKLLKILVFPIVEELAGVAARFAVGRWESAKRPYRLRGFEPGTSHLVDVPALDPAALSRLSEGRALLMVHGTLSRAHVGFGALPADFVEELHRHYEGRVFAFDHYTLSEDPLQNAEWLVRALPEGARLDLDIVCHSRGGLVSRVLTEREVHRTRITCDQRWKGRVRGAPNAGTALADWQHIGDLVDTYTNLLQFFPTPA